MTPDPRVRRRWVGGWFVALAVTVAACSGSGSSPASETTSTPAVSSPAVGPTVTSPGPGATEGGGYPPVPSSVEIPAGEEASPAGGEVPAGEPVEGDVGLDDPYYPDWGNGGYDAVLYTLEMTIRPGEELVDAVVIMEAVATESLSGFDLDYAGPSLSKVAVNGVEADWVQEGEELRIRPAEPLPAGAEFTVQTSYSSFPNSVPTPAWPQGVGWQAPRPDLVYVVSEPNGARGWYPVNDHPSDKALYRFVLTVPEPLSAVANGVLVRRTAAEDAGSGAMVTFEYETHHPMASYLATIAVGEFTTQSSTGPDGIEIRNFVAPRLVTAAGPALDLQATMIEELVPLFGPFPFEVYGALVVDSDFGGALENQTLSVFSGGMFGSPVLAEEVVVHELAHQWFGDSVTIDNWQDIWLNEGFATYAEWLWRERTEPDFDLDAFATATADSGRPIWGPPGDPGPAGLFDSTVYIRGALTLHELRLKVGDDVFFEILRTYTARYADSTVDTSQFVAVAEEVSGLQLSALFDAWLYGERTPELTSG